MNHQQVVGSDLKDKLHESIHTQIRILEYKL
jgi:hypothetical protein